MHGKIFLRFIVVAFSTIAYGAQDLTKAQIDAAYRQAKIESIGVKVTSLVSLGLLAGYNINASIKEILEINSGRSPSRSRLNNNLMLGSILGMGLVPLAGIVLPDAYYAQKYRVSLKVADAARLTLRPLSLTLVRQMFLDAEKRDAEGLRASLSKVLEQEMGKDWQQKLKAKLRTDNNTFDDTLFLISVLENLYNSNLYTGGSFEPQIIKMVAQNLLRAINMLSEESNKK